MLNKSKNTKKVQVLISEQLQDVKACLISFESFIRAACTQGTTEDTLNSLAAAVSSKEADADISLRAMIDSLANGSYLPSTREDIIAVASKCDGIANKCEGAANMLAFRGFAIPAEYGEGLLEIITITHEQFETLEKSIDMLFSRFDELLRNHAILDEIRVFETRIDRIEQNMYRKIFKLDMGLAERNQIAEFVSMVCDVSDVIENIADKLQIMLITRKV